MARIFSKSFASLCLSIIFVQICGLFLVAPLAAEAEEVKFTPQVTVGEFKENTPTEVSKNTTTIGKYIQAIYDYGVGVVGIIAVVVMMIGGFIWLSAGGNQERISNAKSWIGASLAGLFLVLLSYLILRTVSPSLVNFQTDQITAVQSISTNSNSSETDKTKTDNSVNFIPQITVGKFVEKSINKISNDTGTIAEYIREIYNYAIGVVGIVAVVTLMIGGFLWITAGGNAGQVGNAKAWIGASLAGLLLVLLSYSILSMVNPKLVNLKTSTVADVKEINADTTTSGRVSSHAGCDWINTFALSCAEQHVAADKTESDASDCAAIPKPATYGQTGYKYSCCCTIAAPATATSSQSASQSAAANNLQFKPQVAIGTDFVKTKSYPIEKSTGTIAKYIRAIYKYAISVVGIVAVITMMIGGFLWASAGGSGSQVNNAKAWIGASFAGLLLTLFSYVILKTVNPALVDLKTGTLPRVQTMTNTINQSTLTEGQACIAGQAPYCVNGLECVANKCQKDIYSQNAAASGKYQWKLVSDCNGLMPSKTNYGDNFCPSPKPSSSHRCCGEF